MFISASNERLELRDAHNFKELKLVRAPAHADTVITGQLGRLDGDHVWVDEHWFLAQPPAANEEWIKAFHAMKDYARGKGWVDGAGAIRVHIESEQDAH
tara:strand:- start:4126 stop:4422 length:297 start_codon:yes stop_codon:yes gene_type:complete